MRVVMSRAAKRLQDRDVASAFLSWRSKTQDKNALFLIGAKVVLRWNRLSLSVPFSQWTDLIAEKHAEHLDKAVAVEAERRLTVSGLPNQLDVRTHSQPTKTARQTSLHCEKP